MDNGNGDDGDAILLPGALQQLLILLLRGFWLGQWRMEKDLCHLLPAAGPASSAYVYYPEWTRAMGNGTNGRSHQTRKDIQ
tara:strand:+ start:346 stop:588 length:243 start_codon:yes stop_codon:yes gene_type:complete